LIIIFTVMTLRTTTSLRQTSSVITGAIWLPQVTLLLKICRL